MDDHRFGAVSRATRVKRRMTQRQLAEVAGTSDASVSRLERGRIESMSLATVRAIARALDVRVELLPRSRSGDLERVASAAHAALAEAVVVWLRDFGGWVIRPEIGFSHYGERGVIDLVGWHAGRRMLLIIELKTELVDINALLGALDRYVRNGVNAVAPMGWRPLTVSRLLLVGDSTWNRARVKDHAALFVAALPDGPRQIRAWLRDPVGELAGLMFVRNRHPASSTRRFATVRRVRGTTPRANEHGIAGATRRPAR